MTLSNLTGYHCSPLTRAQVGLDVSQRVCYFPLLASSLSANTTSILSPGLGRRDLIVSFSVTLIDSESATQAISDNIIVILCTFQPAHGDSHCSLIMHLWVFLADLWASCRCRPGLGGLQTYGRASVCSNFTIRSLARLSCVIARKALISSPCVLVIPVSSLLRSSIILLLFKKCFLALSYLFLGSHQLLDGCRHRRQLVVNAVLSFPLADRSRDSLESTCNLLRALASLHYTRSDLYRRHLHPSFPRLPSLHRLPLRTLSAL
jgi:hypothetical protein